MPAAKAKFYKSLLLAVVSTALLVACGQRENRPIYTEEEDYEELEVPDDLDAPDTSRAFMIPGDFLPELAGQRDESRPPRVLSSEEVEQARSRIRFGPRGLFLEVDDEAESVFRRLGFALERGGMRVLDSDSGARSYQFHVDHEPVTEDRRGLARLAFWRSSVIYDYSGDYRIEVEGEGEQARVHLLDENGDLVDLDPAEQILGAIRDRLG